MDKKRVEMYMEEIDSIMRGRSGARMCIYYLDAVKCAAQNDLFLEWDEVTRIHVQATALQEILERYNPDARRVIGAYGEVVSCA